MSIFWLEPFVFDPTGSNIFTFQSLNIMIYLNMFSILCYVVYSLLYKSDLNMQKAPSKHKINFRHTFNMENVRRMFNFISLFNIIFMLLFVIFI